MLLWRQYVRSERQEHQIKTLLAEKWTYVLTLDVPFFPFVARIVGRQIYISHLKNHLKADVPKLLLEVHEEVVMVGALVIDHVWVSSLFWRAEMTWIAVNDWIPGNVCKMYALVTVAWCFQVYECPIEQRNQ